MHFTADAARSLVQYTVKDKPVEEWLTINLNCNTKMVMGVGQQNLCSAFVSRWFAPLGQLDSRIPLFRSMNLTLNQEWMQQWTAAMIRHNVAITEPQRRASLQQGEATQALRTKQHQDLCGR